jgi:hypothetical protein
MRCPDCFADPVDHQTPRHTIERCGRFVREEQIRQTDKRSGDCDALLLPHR